MDKWRDNVEVEGQFGACHGCGYVQERRDKVILQKRRIEGEEEESTAEAILVVDLPRCGGWTGG